MSDNQVVNLILEDLKQIKKDVRELLSWKSRFIGIIIGVSGVFTFLYNIVLPIFMK